MALPSRSAPCRASKAFMLSSSVIKDTKPKPLHIETHSLNDCIIEMTVVRLNERMYDGTAVIDKLKLHKTETVLQTEL